MNFDLAVEHEDLRNEMPLHEKADQAALLLAEVNLDCWLTFARETGLSREPHAARVDSRALPTKILNHDRRGSLPRRSSRQ